MGAVVTEEIVIKSLAETSSKLTSTTDSVDSFLDEILGIQKDISGIIDGIENNNAMIEQLLIQTEPNEPVGGELLNQLSLLNAAVIKFLGSIKRSDSYSAFKTVSKLLEAEARNFQELYQDIKLRNNPDPELLDLLNAAGRTYTNP